jgi:hypothetical protein
MTMTKSLVAPIRLFHGTADDWVAIGSCRAARASAHVAYLWLPNRHVEKANQIATAAGFDDPVSKLDTKLVVFALDDK